MNDIGAQSPTNEHIDRMAGILLTYNFYEKELGMSYGSVSITLDLILLGFNLGYVQGMSDLCAPIYVVMGGNEELTFWCFVEVMNRMVNWIPLERDAQFISCLETEFPARPEWHAETTIHVATAD
jgi:TBC1 domain family member 15